MKLSIFIIASTCTWLAFLLKAEAQSLSALPKLEPSYSEDFSRLKSYPSMCFDNAFFDEQGKLWLTPCPGGQTGLHLFEFNGYEFSVVRGDLDQLPSGAGFAAVDGNGRLIGYVNEPGAQRVVFYDLKSNELTALPLPLAEKDMIAGVFLNDQGEVFAISGAEEHFLLHEMVDGRFVPRSRVESECPDYQCFSSIPYQDGNEIWSLSPARDKLYQSFFATGAKRTFTAADFEIPPAVTDVFPNLAGKLYPIGGRYYYVLDNLEAFRRLILKLEPSSGRFELVDGIPLVLKSARIFSDAQGNLLFVFRSENGEFQAILEDAEGRRYDYSAFFTASLLQGAYVLNVVSPDFRRQLLVCHSKGILLQTVKASDAIAHILPASSIRVMIELPDQRIVIATQEVSGTEFIYDPKTGGLEQWADPACFMNWSKLIKDEKGFIWGLARPDFVQYDPVGNTCRHFPAQPSRTVFAFVGNGKIAYFQRGNPEHLALFDRESGTTSPFTIDDEPLQVEGFVHDMLYSRSGLLWMATTRGLVKVDLEGHTSEIIGLTEPFLDFRFLCIHEDEKGRLWLGTSLGGVHIYNPLTGELKILNSEQGLANNTVPSILADNDGDRWIGAYNGISIVSPEGELIANLYQEDGLVDKECNRYAYLKTSDGTLLIGTVAGLNIIEPVKLKERLRDSEKLKIYLNSISYYAPGGKKLITRRYGLGELGAVTLPASKRNIRLKFAVSNYFKPEYNQYAYQLEGISEDWIPLGNQHSLHLDNLPAGRYRLLVRGSDGAGNDTVEPLAVGIYAKEHFYKQIWFYLLCLAALGGLSLLWIQRLRLEVKKATKIIRSDKETIERQAEKLRELDQAKSRFFTNISHEFRTPLTIISGMVDQVQSKPDQWLEKGAKIIKQNTLNLLNLINQILDLRKLESKDLQLNLMQGDIVRYLRYLKDSYHSYAENEGLQLHFLTTRPSIVMDYDPDKILRIVSNLLSNAIKYNNPGGHIYFYIDQITKEEKSEWLIMRVQDTGAGIPPEKLANIFDRFYQVNEPGERKIVGSGIGLALTRELVQLMNGAIEVQSEPGRGTTFAIQLPITRVSKGWDAFFSPEEKILDQQLLASSLPEEEIASVDIGGKEDADQPSVLIVEDNPQIVQILIACLEDKYQLEIAGNGREGIEKAVEQMPDIVISDVMMPEKNGFELTAALKTDERTDHIPIILLTAKSDVDSKIRGLEKGADAYLAKPFEKRELLIRLEKLLELRKKLQEKYARSAAENSSKKIEDPFLQKVYACVEKQLSNPDLDMNDLCRALAMSRSQIFRKMKALTGQPASLYIRRIRLNKARELLETTDLNISQVAYEVGFNYPNYFSKAFYEEFGMHPNETRK